MLYGKKKSHPLRTALTPGDWARGEGRRIRSTDEEGNAWISEQNSLKVARGIPQVVRKPAKLL